MKLKVLVLAVLLAGISSYAMAQKDSNEVGKYHVGFKSGWHYANMYRSGSAPYDYLNSFYIGFFNEGRVSELMSAGASFEYMQNGFWGSNGSFRMHTLSVPIYSKLHIGPLYGSAGLALNFKLTDNREDFPGPPTTVARVSDPNFFDLPVFLGAGIKVRFVQLDFKYNWGLFRAANIEGLAHKNQYMQLGLSFYLQ